MTKPYLSVDEEFDLMVTYHESIESKSVIVENSIKDKFQFTLYEIVEPYPSYEEYLNGNDFDEGVPIKESSFIEELKQIQEKRKQKA